MVHNTSEELNPAHGILSNGASVREKKKNSVFSYIVIRIN